MASQRNGALCAFLKTSEKKQRFLQILFGPNEKLYSYGLLMRRTIEFYLKKVSHQNDCYKMVNFNQISKCKTILYNAT